jgi:hypothetical protein
VHSFSVVHVYGFFVALIGVALSRRQELLTLAFLRFEISIP